MFTRIYWLHTNANGGKLGIMARPRGDDWLEQEINHFKKQGIGVIVSLLEATEIQELGLQKQSALCAGQEIMFLQFPIADRSVPSSTSGARQLVSLLSEQLNKGLSVVVHCRMGIGRSSIIAGAVLQKDGWKTDELIRHIGKMRGVSVPDTEEQITWLKKL